VETASKSGPTGVYRSKSVSRHDPRKLIRSNCTIAENIQIVRSEAATIVNELFEIWDEKGEVEVRIPQATKAIEFVRPFSALQ
jgi:hypothetical protein